MRATSIAMGNNCSQLIPIGHAVVAYTSAKRSTHDNHVEPHMEAEQATHERAQQLVDVAATQTGKQVARALLRRLFPTCNLSDQGVWGED